MREAFDKQGFAVHLDKWQINYTFLKISSIGKAFRTLPSNTFLRQLVSEGWKLPHYLDIYVVFKWCISKSLQTFWGLLVMEIGGFEVGGVVCKKFQEFILLQLLSFYWFLRMDFYIMFHSFKQRVLWWLILCPFD